MMNNNRLNTLYQPELESIKNSASDSFNWHAYVEDLAVMPLIGIIPIFSMVACEVIVNLSHYLFCVCCKVESLGPRRIVLELKVCISVMLQLTRS